MLEGKIKSMAHFQTTIVYILLSKGIITEDYFEQCLDYVDKTFMNKR